MRNGYLEVKHIELTGDELKILARVNSLEGEVLDRHQISRFATDAIVKRLVEEWYFEHGGEVLNSISVNHIVNSVMLQLGKTMVGER